MENGKKNKFFKKIKGRKLSEESKQKMKGNKNALGHKVSKKSRLIMSLKKIGNKINLGHKHSEGTKEKIRQKKIGIKHSNIWNKNIGLGNKGKEGYFKNKKLSDNHKRNIGNGNKGKHFWTKEMREKLSLKVRGKNGSNWQGGLTKKLYPYNWTISLRKTIRERDKYICQICFNNGFVVHHIDYNKQNCNPSNLITLCNRCHLKTNFNRNIWKKYFANLIMGRNYD